MISFCGTILSCFLCITISVVVASVDPKIVGGIIALPMQLPYQVSLKYQGNHRCGGTIVNHRHVVTAGHCIVNEQSRLVPIDTLRVDVGSLDISGRGGESHYVEKLHLPKDYSTSIPMTHDIGVIRIKGKFEFNYHVEALPLSPRPYTPATPCKTSGWGAIRDQGSLSNQLLYIDVPLIEINSCQAMIDSPLALDMLCAGYIAGAKGVCQGDSGGPLKCGGYLVGVVSHGYKCAEPGYPAIYTDVYFHNKWITDILKSSSFVVNPFTPLIFTLIIFNLCT